MRHQAFLPVLLLCAAVLAAAAPASLADHAGGWTEPPAGAAVADGGPLAFAAWSSQPGNLSENRSFQPGDPGTLHAAWRDLPGGGNATYNATVSVEAPPNVTLEDPPARNRTLETGNVSGNDTGGPWLHPEAVAFSVAGDAPDGGYTFTVDVTVYQANTTQRNASGNETRNVTTWEEAAAYGLSYGISVAAPPPPEDGIPWLLVAGAVTAAGAAAAGGAYVIRRRRGPPAERRSNALRELEAEGDEEVQQEVRRERARERQDRELRILEAKAEDHRESIERARQRHEEGELTEHQFERIKERKEAALEDVLDDLEEKRQEQDG